jgi:hypothetical protein
MIAGIMVTIATPKHAGFSAAGLVAGALLAITLLFASTAAADLPRARSESGEDRLARGDVAPEDTGPTWFMAEFGLGPAIGSGFPEYPVGVGLRGALGVGGGFEGSPFRFYALATLRYTSMWAHTESGTLSSDINRKLFDVSGDLRILWALSRFRLMFDLGLGGSFLSSTADINGRQTFQTDDARFAVYVAGGIGYRFARWLSASVLVEGVIPTTRPQADFVASASRLPDNNGDDLGWTTIFFNASFHF